MKQLRFTMAAGLSLLLAPFLGAQTPTPAPPPIQSGLWHEEVVTTITGIDGVSPSPQIDRERFCISPESWQKFGLQSANSTSCSISNRQQEAGKLSYDISCSPSGSTPIIIHMNVQIDNDRQMHGTAIATIAAPGSSRHGTWTSSVTEHYVASGCGDLKPGEKKPVR